MEPLRRAVEEQRLRKSIKKIHTEDKGALENAKKNIHTVRGKLNRGTPRNTILIGAQKKKRWVAGIKKEYKEILRKSRP